MNKILSNKYLLFISRLIIGFIFIYAGAEKIADPSGFSDSIYNYKIFPLFSINVFAIVIPWIEVAAGVLLIFGVAVKENAFILSSLLIIFIVLISVSMIRGLDFNCGCFGSGNHPIGFQKIIENIFTLIPGILLMIFGSDYLSITDEK